MATKDVKKSKKSLKAVNATAIDPFESTVELSAEAKTAKPKRAAKVKPVAQTKPAETAKTKRTRTKKVDVRPIEPFAEIALADDNLRELPGMPTPKRRRTSTVATSPAKPRKSKVTEPTLDVTADLAAVEPEVELSPVFKTLAEVKLPELAPESRARLLVQSPTRLYFYWALNANPWQQLRGVFGPDLGSYVLIAKLRNLTSQTETIQPIEAEGEWWFSAVDPDAEYMAEIGFYATNRPYFRVLHSNTVTTPRRSPSPHPATEARWTVSATKFAEVLDASGFSRDAMDVAIAGDDHLSAEHRTQLALSELIGEMDTPTRGFGGEDIRYAMLAIAGGAKLEELRHRVSASLFEILQSAGDITASDARKALASQFEIDESEWIEHELGSAVFGASLVHFPRTLKPRRGTVYTPLSSHSVGR